LVPFFRVSEKKPMLLEIFRNLICQISVVFKNPETTNTIKKRPESATDYYTALSADVRNTSYHKNLHCPYLGVVNIRKVI
jgi:hypothetical protein